MTKSGPAMVAGSSLPGVFDSTFSTMFVGGKPMKKKVKKLELNKETVRNLSTDDLKKIAGGTVVTKPVTICNSCRPTLCP
jgi:hypothetical protein